MPKKTLQLYRGTTAQNDAFTGVAGEVTMDTTTNQLRVHDGSTAGGHKVAKDSDVVHLDGTETITGTKTLLRSDSRAIYNKSSIINKTVTPGSNQYLYTDFVDKNNTRLGVIGVIKNTAGRYGVYMQCGNVTSINLTVDQNDANPQFNILTPATDDNSTQAASTAFVNNFSDAKVAQYTSNCVSNIPQDIKLTLSSGTITLKAGSVLYIPNGSGTFTKVTTTSDITASGASSNPNAVRLLYYNNGTLQIYSLHSSGTTPPATGTNQMFYNSSDNTIKRYTNGSVVASGYSFPLAMIKDDGTYLYGSIEQVFNGIGYIGSHVFFLPGYSVLTPNGRSADGTLASQKYTFTSCTVYTRNLTGSDVPLLVRYDGTITFSTGVPYDPITNQSSGYAQVGTATLASGVISNFKPKTAFRMSDYNDVVMKTVFEAADAQNVKLTGNQTIAGTKTFSSAAYGVASDANNSIVTTVSKTKSSTGGFKLGNGLIINWGIVSARAIAAHASSAATANFAIPFTSSNYAISLVTSAGTYYANTQVGYVTRNTSSCSLTQYNNGAYATDDLALLWIAVGY